MITKDEIQELLHSTETYRVERTTSTGDMDKFREAICALSLEWGRGMLFAKFWKIMGIPFWSAPETIMTEKGLCWRSSIGRIDLYGY